MLTRLPHGIKRQTLKKLFQTSYHSEQSDFRQKVNRLRN